VFFLISLNLRLLLAVLFTLFSSSVFSGVSVSIAVFPFFYPPFLKLFLEIVFLGMVLYALVILMFLMTDDPNLVMLFFLAEN